MTIARPWNPPRAVSGPHRIGVTDIDAVNRVFSDAFTERYRQDGMVGVRVPQLNPAIWRYAIEDARDGAMLWRDEHGEVVAFNVAHRSGVEGWMGPLAVRPEWQGSGLGKAIVREGIAWLRANGCSVIGLETMPRTMDNIGFYSSLGFLPGRLTITLTLEASERDRPVSLIGSLPPADRVKAVAACRDLTTLALPGYDFSRELDLTLDLGLGDVVVVRDGARLEGFALFHAASLVEGRSRDELRVLKMVLRSEDVVEAMAVSLSDAVRRTGTRRVAMRVQSDYEGVYRRLIERGARVRWTDLRMAVDGYSERRAANGSVVFSNWEI
ncbi:MAG: GNAT family N-acetyltransferase [Gemmatimonadaceae bacterium]|nr:GNAT family N-acetyltransferase [Gemmatimonadaceae bacterium]